MARTTQRQAAAAENDSSDDERQQAPSTSYKNLSPQGTRYEFCMWAPVFIFPVSDYNQREEPLSEASVTRLNNLKLDWKRHSEDMIELVNTLAEAAEELAEAFADEPDSEEWNKVIRC